MLLWVLSTAVVLALILVPYAIWGEAIESWTRGFIADARSEPMVFAMVLGGLLAGDILLPVPSSVVSTACGMLLGFLPGLLVSFLGMSVGSFAGYALGRWGGRRLLDRFLDQNDAKRFEEWNRRFGDWAVVACRPVPVLAEASVLMAGAARIPVARYAAMVSLSNLAVSAVYAAAGAWSAGLNSFLLAFGLSIAVPGAVRLLAARGKASRADVNAHGPR